MLSRDTLQNCPSQTTTPPSHPLPVTVSVTVSVRHTLRHILRHILRHTLCSSHVPLHHPTPPTLSIHFTFPHTIGNLSLLNNCISVTISMTFHDKLCHRLRHVIYHSIVLLLSLFFYIYNLTLILAEVLSYSFKAPHPNALLAAIQKMCPQQKSQRYCLRTAKSCLLNCHPTSHSNKWAH